MDSPIGPDYWRDQDDKYPVEDWKYEVENNDTRLGYWEWAHARRESEET